MYFYFEKDELLNRNISGRNMRGHTDLFSQRGEEASTQHTSLQSGSLVVVVTIINIYTHIVSNLLYITHDTTSHYLCMYTLLNIIYMHIKRYIFFSPN